MIWLEKHLPWLSLFSFIIGLLLAQFLPEFAQSIGAVVEAFVQSYSYAAPIAIYLILTPSLLKLLTDEHRGKRFAYHAIYWFAKARLAASLFAIVLTALLFDLPLISRDGDLQQAATEAAESLLWMVTHSVYFYAIFASLGSVALILRSPRWSHRLAQGVDLIEQFGEFIVPLVLVAMVAFGAYLTVLPELLQQQLGAELAHATLSTVHLFGISMDPATASGIFMIYIVGAFATGLACMLWHGGLILLVIHKMPSFSLKSYFYDYLFKVYPLLWATASEALATPLNLRMVKQFCPDMRDEVRQFVVGTGSFMNINGTMINVFIMTGLVAAILNIDLSVLQLVLSLPIVFLIGYGVPGIPGELILFAGPMAISIGVSPELSPLFISLYVGLQIGLPDSFRTATNSTDECLCALILNKNY